MQNNEDSDEKNESNQHSRGKWKPGHKMLEHTKNNRAKCMIVSEKKAK